MEAGCNGLLDNRELAAANRLFKNYGTEIRELGQGLDLADKVTNTMAGARFVSLFGSIFSCEDDGIPARLEKESFLIISKGQMGESFKYLASDAAGQSTSDFVCPFLFIEAVERLRSAYLLLKTGHLSRSYSCQRDAWECLVSAEICHYDNRQARRYMKGQKVQPSKGFAHSWLSKDTIEGINAFMNKWGTHTYIEASALSLVGERAAIDSITLSDRVAKNRSEKDNYLNNIEVRAIQQCILFLNTLIGAIILCIWQYWPEIENKFDNFSLSLQEFRSRVDNFRQRSGMMQFG